MLYHIFEGYVRVLFIAGIVGESSKTVASTRHLLTWGRERERRGGRGGGGRGRGGERRGGRGGKGRERGRRGGGGRREREKGGREGEEGRRGGGHNSKRYWDHMCEMHMASPSSSPLLS